MRIWDWKILPYLPDLQFKGQLRELVLIMHQWRNNGQTNHLLINKVMEYPKSDLVEYFYKYNSEYKNRYGHEVNVKYLYEFNNFDEFETSGRHEGGYVKKDIFKNWHNKEYLHICMANLYEKHFCGVGRSQITGIEWYKLTEGYKTITGEEYKI